MSFYIVNQPNWINLFICILRYVLHTLCTFHSDPLNHSFSLAKKVKCRDWLMHEVVRYGTPPQYEQEWVLEQVTKALCPVPEGMLLPPETGLHLEPHPLSNKGRVSLPNNSCLHSSMLILWYRSFALTRTFFSILIFSQACNDLCRLGTSHGPSFQPAYITYHIHTLLTSNLKTEAAHASKNLVSTNKNTWYHNPEQYCLWISRFRMLQICKHPSLYLLVMPWNKKKDRTRVPHRSDTKRLHTQ